MIPEYLMRSLLFAPAHNEHLLDSALRRDADVLILDIEDSVQPQSNKQVARDVILKYLKAGKFKDKIVFARVNDRESGELLKDVYQLTEAGIEGFMYPKSTQGDDIYFFGKLLETIEYEKGYPIGTFKIIGLLETTGAIMNVQDICRACPERLVAISFGCEDFTTDLHGIHDDDGKNIFYPRAIVAMAARANNVLPIDTVHIKVHDLEDLEKNLQLAVTLGFEGMMILNPKELPLCHQYFSPSPEKVQWAKDMLLLAAEAEHAGKGVDVKHDRFIGPPMVKMAEDILKKQKVIEKNNAAHKEF